MSLEINIRVLPEVYPMLGKKRDDLVDWVCCEDFKYINRELQKAIIAKLTMLQVTE